MSLHDRPTFRSLFEKQSVVVIKREYRRIYKLNWKAFFSNLYGLIAFWKPDHQRFKYRYASAYMLQAQQDPDDLAVIRDPVIKNSTDGTNNL